MTTVPFICSKSGRQLVPEQAGQCHICHKLFAREYLGMWEFKGGKFPECEDDLQRLKDFVFALRE